MAKLWQHFSIALRRLSGVISDGMLFSGRPDLMELDLDRDSPEIIRLIEQKEWPILRSDLEVSIEQPRAAAFVARKDGEFAGFFLGTSFW